MHTLVELQQIARKEFIRGLQGLSDDDSRRRIEPMNSIGWIIGHVAHQRHMLFVAWPQGKEIKPEYRTFGTGNPASEPSLDHMMALWQQSCDEADVWLQHATEASLQELNTASWSENMGTLLVRHIFHTWCHLGEISAIRQVLGHRPPTLSTCTAGLSRAGDRTFSEGRDILPTRSQGLDAGKMEYSSLTDHGLVRVCVTIES